MVYLTLAYSRWIGIIAGIFTTASLIPPLVKLIREKKPEHIPMGMLFVLLVGLSLWIYYGFLNKDLPILITNSISLAQNVTMLALGNLYKNNK